MVIPDVTPAPLGYAHLVDIRAIVAAIDAELEHLTQARNILVEFAGPAPTKKKQVRRRARASNPEPVPVPAEVPLTVLPPRRTRQHRQRVQPAAAEPRAVASSIPDKPVFVPKETIAAHPMPAEKAAAPSGEALEAMVRKNLFGDRA
jgi:hypothetical protein